VPAAAAAGVALAKYWGGCGLSAKHSQPRTADWSYGFRSAGLARPVTSSSVATYSLALR